MDQLSDPTLTEVPAPGAPPAPTPAPSKNNKPAPVPDYARTVLVPIAKAETAGKLLNLAQAVVRADGGRVIALAVLQGDADAEANIRKVAALESVIRAMDERRDAREASATRDEEGGKDPADDGANVKLELVKRSSGSIARGILDVALERNADLIIMGLRSPEHQHIEIGQVVESVVEAAPCDVLIYREGLSPAFSRISVLVDGSEASRTAARMGIILSNGFGRPVDVMTVQEGNRPSYEGHARIEMALDGVRGRGACNRRVVPGVTVADGVLTHTDDDTLVVMGFTSRGELHTWLLGDTLMRVLGKAPGPVLLAVRHATPTTLADRMTRPLARLRPVLTDVEQEQVSWTSERNAGISVDFLVLAVVSAVLATCGLLLNSPAVIIGAMLVAPLMGPLVSFSAGLATGALEVLRRAAVTVAIGTLTVVGVAVLIGLAASLNTPTSEMLARGNPTFLDAAVALASGVVGAYATARKEIPAALAGVAIAAALVPPICTVGLALAFGAWGLALGAGLLFLTNIVCIAVIGSGVFVWLGMTPRSLRPGTRSAYVLVLVLAALALPGVVGLLNASQRANTAQRIERSLTPVLAGADMRVVNIEVSSGDPTLVTATVRGPNLLTQTEMVRARQAVVDAMETSNVRLEMVFQRVLSVGEGGDAPESDPSDAEDDAGQVPGVNQ